MHKTVIGGGAFALLALACSSSQEPLETPPTDTAAAEVTPPSTGEVPDDSPAPEEKPAAGEEQVKQCQDMMDKTLACADPFLTMLVDMRVELDFPEGIADKAKKDKKALMDEAHAELKVDATDPKRTETCKKVAANAPPEELKAAHDCAQKDKCEEFVACIKPVQKRRFEHIMKQDAK